jgi:hypothetical protein
MARRFASRAAALGPPRSGRRARAAALGPPRSGRRCRGRGVHIFPRRRRMTRVWTCAFELVRWRLVGRSAMKGADRRLAARAAAAERFFADDPRMCLMNLRVFAELLARRAAAHLGIAVDSRTPRVDVLRALNDRGARSSLVRELFHRLCIAGYDATHEAAISFIAQWLIRSRRASLLTKHRSRWPIGFSPGGGAVSAAASSAWPPWSLWWTVTRSPSKCGSHRKASERCGKPGAFESRN